MPAGINGPKAKLFAEILSGNSDIDGSGISFLVHPF